MIQRSKLIWFLLMILLLLVSVLWYWLSGDSSQEEILIEFSLLTIFLTFPVGYIVYAGAGLIAWLLNYEAGGVLYAVALWIISLITGYYQWFRLLPYIVEKVRKKHHKATK
ncbi:MAG: hypothetical protein AB2794_09645 [Candidatus Thiodiazotropha endolucinida]